MSDGRLLNQLSQGHAPMVSGRPHVPITGLEGFPGMQSGGAMGMLAQFVLGPMIQKMMGNAGFMPILGHDQNTYDVMRNLQFTQHQQAVMRDAAELDRENFQRTFRGIAAMTGTPWGSQQRRAAGQLADIGQMMAPMMAQVAPELLDQLAGMRGSATVMANRMLLGGRYRLDPATGLYGQTPESVGAMQERIYSDLFESGNLAQMRGISAGQLGTMYDELSRRGRIAGPQMPVGYQTLRATNELARETPERFREIAQRAGITDMPEDLTKLTAGQLDQLRGQPEVADRLRAFDADRVKRSLTSYVDALSTMREIFGDMGQPNAPIQKLIQGLEALTQGAGAQLDPGRLNMIARTTHQLARQSGMSVDQILAVQQHAAGRAEQLGISRIHGIQAAQGSAAWGQAFRAMGGSAVPAWGRFNAEQMSQLDTNLRVQAASSNQSNRLALLMRVERAAGGFEEGTAAAAMATAIRARQTEFFDPETQQVRSMMMGGQDFMDILTGATGAGGTALGIDEGQVASMLAQRGTQEQFIEQFAIGDLTRRMQPQDAQNWVAGRLSESLASRLEAAGMARSDAIQAAEQASDRIAQRTFRLTQGQFATDRTRNARVAQFIEEELAGTEAGEFLTQQGMGEDWYRLTAETGYGYVNRAIKADPRRRAMGNFQNVHATMNEETLRQGERSRAQALMAVETAEILAPLGQGSPIRRAVQSLQDMRPGDEDDGNNRAIRLIGEAFGVKTENVNEALRENIIQVSQQQTKLDELQKTYLNAPDSRSKTRAMRDIETQRQTMKESVNKLVGLAEQQGYDLEGDMLGREDITEAITRVQRARRATDTTQAIRSTTGFDVEAGELTPWRDQTIRQVIDKGEIRLSETHGQNVAAQVLVNRRLAEARDVSDKEVRAFIEAREKETGTTFTDTQKEQARDVLIRQREQGAYQFKEGEVEEFMESGKLTEDDLEGAVMAYREGIALTPTRAEAAAIQRQFGEDVTREQALDYAAALRRADRFGITTGALTEARKAEDIDVDVPMEELTGQPAMMKEIRAINRAIESRYSMDFDVDPEGDEVKKVMQDEKIASKEAAQRHIIRSRVSERANRIDTFLSSDAGAAYREDISYMMQAVEDVTTKGALSKKLMRRLGPQALDTMDELRTHKTRLNELAYLYAEGDVSRLGIGHLDLDLTKPGQRERLAEIQDQVRTAQAGMQRGLSQLQDQIGKPGRQWGEDDAATAESLLGTDKWAEMSDEEKQDYLGKVKAARSLTDVQVAEVESYDDAMTQVDAYTSKFGKFGKDESMSAQEFITGFTQPDDKRPDWAKPMTDGEAEAVQKAKEAWWKINDEEAESAKAIDMQAAELERNPPPKDPADPDYKDGQERQKAYDDAKTAHEAKFKDAVSKATAGLAPIAEKYGYKDTNAFVLNSGAFTKARMDKMGADAARAAETGKNVKAIAKAHDVSVDQAVGAQGVYQTMDEKVSEAAESSDVTDALSGVFEAAGLEKAEYEKLAPQLARHLVSPGASDMALFTRDQIDRMKEIAVSSGQDKEGKSAMSGVLDMSSTYLSTLKETGSRLKAREKLQEDYGLQVGEAKEVSRFARFGEESGILAALGEDVEPDKRREILSRAFQSMGAGAKYGRSLQDQAASETRYLEGKLTIDHKNNTGDLAARMGQQ